MELKFNLHELEPIILVHFFKDPIFFLKIKESIKPSYFQNEKLAKVFEVVSNYHTKYNSLPQQETMRTLFKKKYEQSASEYTDIIDMIYSYNKPYDKAYIIDNSIKFIKQAKVIEAIRCSIPKIDAGEYDEIYEAIKNAVVVDFDKKLGISFKNDTPTKLKENTFKPRLLSGYETIDSKSGGGFEGGCLYVFSGNYGIGKSIWLQNVALKQMLNGRNVIYYTLELSERAVMKRLTSIYSEIKQDEFNERLKDIDKQWETLRMTTSGDVIIKEYPTGTATVNDFRANMEELKAINGFKPDILFVDYCNIMDSLKTISMENTYVRTKYLYEELRALAQELDIPIVTAAQINRGGMDEKKGGTKQLVTGANIADSLGIAMTVDIHWVINQTNEEKENGVVRLYWDKNRQGPDKFTSAFGIVYENLTINDGMDLS